MKVVTVKHYFAEPIAEVVYFIEGDAYENKSMVIEHKGERWIVLSWFRFHATGERCPDLIAPLKKWSHHQFEDGVIQLYDPVPGGLFSVDPSAELRKEYGVEMYPDVA